MNGVSECGLRKFSTKVMTLNVVPVAHFVSCYMVTIGTYHVIQDFWIQAVYNFVSS